MTLVRDGDLLRQVADHIEAHPERYDQNVWLDSDPYDLRDRGIDHTRAGSDAMLPFLIEGSCGTRACVAGWCVALNIGDPEFLENVKAYDNIPKHARELIDKVLDRQQINILFDDRWEPVEGMTVPEALRALADGEHLYDVTDPEAWAKIYNDR